MSISGKRRLILLAAIMSMVAFVVVSTTMYVLYETAFDQQRSRLVETVQGRARLMEAVARYDLDDYRKHHRRDAVDQHGHTDEELIGDALTATLSQLKDAHRYFQGFGETGEFVLARRQDDQIVFLLRQRHDDLDNPRPVPFNSRNAEPMRRALTGLSGTVVGMDHRGEQVLAAYEPVAVLNLGVVAKIDLAEIRAPFVRTAGVAIALALALIFLGTLAFFRVGNPMVESLRQSEEKYRQLFSAESDAILLFDSETFDFTDVNEAALKLYGYSREEFLHLNVSDVSAEVSQTMNTVTKMRDGDTSRVTLRYHKKKNGTVFPVEIAPGSFYLGSRKVLFGLITDITERKQSEEALRESEERHRVLFEGSSVGILAADIETKKFVFANSAVCRMIGYTQKEFEDMSVADIHPEESLPHVISEFEATARGDKTLAPGIPILTKTGEVIYADISAATLQIGDQVCNVGFMTDITERKRVVEALRKSEERYAEITNCMPGAVYQFKMDKQGRFSMPFMSDTLESITGVPARVLMEDANKMFDYLHPDDHERFLASITTSAESMKTWELEFRIIVPGKRETWVKGISNPRALPGGEILWNGVLVNITERKQAVEALRDSEEQFRRITERLFDVVITTDLDTTVKYCSPSIERVFGYKPEEVVGSPISDFIPESGLPILRETFQTTGAGELVEGTQCPFIRKDGTVAYIEVNAVPIRKDGLIVGAQCVIRDITDRKRMEEELANKEKLESIGVLAGGIAHDFNNVLTGVGGNLQLALCDIDADSEAGLCLKDADLALARAADLTQQLLTFAKGGAPVKKTASIKEIIEQSSRFALHGSNVRCELSLQDDLLNTEIDVGQINQVINNLIINADQAMPTGGTLFLKAANHRVNSDSSLPLSPGDYICITVRDQGVGIEEDNQRRIFDPFYTTKSRGSGLGLATSYSIVKNHRGHIEVNSTPGHGAEFRVYLPATSAAALSGSEKPVPSKNVGGRILVMDDEACVRDVASRALRRQDFEVDTAVDGVEAIDLFAKAGAEGRPYAAVILDLTVPGGLGGIETVAQLRRIDPDIPAIVCSGYSTDPILANFREHGFQAILAKPFRPQELIRTVNQLLAGVCQAFAESPHAETPA